VGEFVFYAERIEFQGFPSPPGPRCKCSYPSNSQLRRRKDSPWGPRGAASANFCAIANRPPGHMPIISKIYGAYPFLIERSLPEIPPGVFTQSLHIPVHNRSRPGSLLPPQTFPFRGLPSVVDELGSACPVDIQQLHKRPPRSVTSFISLACTE